MNWENLLHQEKTRRQAITTGMVVPDQKRCVQCGICSFHCPINIDVRQHAWTGVPVKDSHCLTCGECICRCPRGVLSFVKASSLSKQEMG
jgi:NAD-dependent dihydropyrimidine dehydrogenase PreA subunit